MVAKKVSMRNIKEILRLKFEAKLSHRLIAQSLRVAVQTVERWILAKLRHNTFFTLSELNNAIKRLLEDLNQRPFKKLPGTRKSQFEALDKPVLKALPNTAYHYTEFKRVRVHIDYPIEFGCSYHSGCLPTVLF